MVGAGPVSPGSVHPAKLAAVRTGQEAAEEAAGGRGRAVEEQREGDHTHIPLEKTS